MALSFNQQKGGAQKSSVTSYKYIEGKNTYRLVGDILARYVYWIKGENGKNIPFECLSFDRNEEAFTNKEKDWIRDYFPDLKCGWSYAMQCIDFTDKTLKVVNLKKKLFEQIMVAAEDLGDPTDVEKGWDIQFLRVKTGPLPFNVEYQLQALKCKTRPLTKEERELISEIRSMDDIMKRPTPDAQKELLDRITKGSQEVDSEIEKEFDIK